MPTERDEPVRRGRQSRDAPGRETRRAPVAWAAVASAACSFASVMVGWLAGGAEVDVPWAPALGLFMASMVGLACARGGAKAGRE